MSWTLLFNHDFDKSVVAAVPWKVTAKTTHYMKGPR